MEQDKPAPHGRRTVVGAPFFSFSFRRAVRHGPAPPQPGEEKIEFGELSFHLAEAKLEARDCITRHGVKVGPSVGGRLRVWNLQSGLWIFGVWNNFVQTEYE